MAERNDGSDDEIAREALLAEEEDWKDDFYSDENDIEAVFDIDYDALFEQAKRSKWFALGSSGLFLLIFLLIPFGELKQTSGVLCCGLLVAFVGLGATEEKTKERLYGKHVALTVRGIRVDTQHDSIHTTTTYPYTNIKAVELQRSLFCSGGLSSVQIQFTTLTAKTVHIEGLKQSERFVELVEAKIATSQEEHDKLQPVQV